MSAPLLPLPDPDERWALFLDMDGTLFDLIDDPELVRATPALLEILDALTEQLDGALALISGRDLSAIDRIMAPRRYPAAGSHGAEWRLSETGDILATAPDTAALAAAAAEMERFIATCPGVNLERKTQSLALHYRLQPQAKDQVLTAAEAVLRRLGEGYRMMPGKGVYEIAPAVGDKGVAITRFLESPPFHGRRPVFAGDDVTDERGFEVVNQQGGLSIHIGSATETHACLHCPSPTALRHWLESVLLHAQRKR